MSASFKTSLAAAAPAEGKIKKNGSIGERKPSIHSAYAPFNFSFIIHHSMKHILRLIEHNLRLPPGRQQRSRSRRQLRTMGRSAPSAPHISVWMRLILPSLSRPDSLSEKWKDFITIIRSRWLLADHPNCVGTGTKGTGESA
jgi:hypothetical protein